MFYEMSPEMKQHASESGEVEFRPAVKWKGTGSSFSYARYEMFFVYTNGSADELGSFYLSLREDYCYEITALEFKAKAGKGLKMLLFEQILKTAIKEACLSGVGQLSVECNHPFIVDAFLTCKFRIEKFDQINPLRPTWKGTKEIDVTKERPLLPMATGQGTL